MRDSLTVRPSQVEDCAELALTLRDADLKEIALAGASSPYEALMRGYVNSEDPQTIMAPDGSVAAMWGVVRLSPGLGSPWMLGSDSLEKHKWQFLREGKEHVAKLHADFPYLYNEVWEGNTLHIRWLKWMGFTVSEAPAHRPRFLPFWKSTTTKE